MELLGKIAKKIHHCYKINNNNFILLAARASLMNINLFESIRIFIEIVESGSLSRAAENLQIHRPAVTKALQLLEQHSGTRLLQRTTRRISLTPDGDAFYRRSKPLLAQADEFIMQFPDQYDTHIEQGGSNVSGGQKQRLCIARALLKKPKILILDDSTSAVDTRTDAQIRKALREYIPETTKIIIAQRISSVQDADRILVMDGGTICNIGTHEELLKTSEIYREVYTSQNKGGDSDEK